MSRRLEDLDGKFRPTIEEIIKETETEYRVYKPFFTYRSPSEQAALWVGSREYPVVKRNIDKFKGSMAVLLERAWSENHGVKTAWKTNALPGFSWHQHRLAVDLYSLDKKTRKAVWTRSYYDDLEEAAIKAGLTSGYRWTNPDPCHVQLWDRGVTLNEAMEALECSI